MIYKANLQKIKDIEFVNLKQILFEKTKHLFFNFAQNTSDKEIIIITETICKYLYSSYNELYLHEIDILFDDILKNDNIKKISTKIIISEINKYYPTSIFKKQSDNFETQRERIYNTSLIQKNESEYGKALVWKVCIPLEFLRPVMRTFLIRDIVANNYHKRDWHDVFLELGFI